MSSEAQLELERITVCYAMHDDGPKPVEEILNLPECCWTDWASMSMISAFRELAKEGEKINPVTVAHWMRSRKTFEAFQLIFSQADYANICNFRESIVRISEYGKKRAIAAVGASIAQKSKNPDVTAEDLEKFAWQALTSAGDVQVRRTASMRPTSYREMMHGYADRLGSVNTNSNRLTTPFPELDRITGGIPSVGLVVLASRPKMGKSAIATQIGRHVAAQHGPVLEITLEMETSELSERLVAQSTRKPKDSHRPEDAIEESIQVLKYDFFDDGNSLKIIDKRIKRYKKDNPDTKLVIIDQLGLIRLENTGGRIPRAEALGEITTHLKGLSSRLKICILLLHQIRRQGDRANQKPTMEDLKDSGKVEEDANMILLLWRKNMSDTRALLDVAGNRAGDTGEVWLEWRREWVSYLTETSSHHEPQDDGGYSSYSKPSWDTVPMEETYIDKDLF